MNLIKKSKLSLEKTRKLVSLRFKSRTIFKNRLWFIIGPAFLLSLIWFSLIVWIKVIPHKTPKVHYHAGFIVVKGNQLVDFSDLKYMGTEMCGMSTAKSDDQENPQELQIEKAHLHALVPDVVHVEIANSKWKDLFLNLKYPIDYKNVTAYINGKLTNDFQNKTIQHYDSLVVFIGRNDKQNFFDKAVSKEHIDEIAQNSVDCGSH